MGKRGFGSAKMNKERQRQIAGMGGKAAHASGKAHKYNAEEAAAAGKLGGLKVSADRQHMADIGRLGGLAAQARRKAAASAAPGEAVGATADSTITSRSRFSEEEE